MLPRALAEINLKSDGAELMAEADTTSIWKLFLWDGAWDSCCSAGLQPLFALSLCGRDLRRLHRIFYFLRAVRYP